MGTMPHPTLSSTLSSLLLSLLLTQAQAQATTQIITLTSTLAASTLTLTAASTPTPIPPQFTNQQSFEFSILNSTNFFRYLHPAPYLTYNESLASFAQSYADECNWKHNPAISEMGLGYGENLARGYSMPGDAIDAWGNERSIFNFDFNIGGDGDEYTGFTLETGHFTQLIWSGTRSVGCGWKDCSVSVSDDESKTKSKRKRGDITSGIFLVCNYFPAGNIMASKEDGGDEYMFFKQNVVLERVGGAEGFNAEEAGRGVGPSETRTESVVGTITASAGAVKYRLEGLLGNGIGGGMGSLGVVSLGVVSLGVAVGMGMGVGLL